MAFSLEAALVVPLSISTWLVMLMTAGPAYQEVRCAAHLEVLAAGCQLENRHLYYTACIEAEGAWTLALQTSPQAVLEIASLISDDWRIVSQLASDSNGLQNETGEGKP